MAFGIYVSYISKGKLATKLIAALGYKKPAYVDLGMVSQKAKAAWEQENGKPFPVDDYDSHAFFY